VSSMQEFEERWEKYVADTKIKFSQHGTRMPTDLRFK